jgi:hypothetical protein
MFYEIRGVKQEPGEPLRRWFQTDDMDLTVWMNGQDLVRFQLSYNRHLGEKTVLWSSREGFSHHLIDDGEQEPGHYKASPIVTDDLPLDFNEVIHSLKKAMSGEQDRLFDVILELLEGAGDR